MRSQRICEHSYFRVTSPREHLLPAAAGELQPADEDDCVFLTSSSSHSSITVRRSVAIETRARAGRVVLSAEAEEVVGYNLPSLSDAVASETVRPAGKNSSHAGR